MDTNLTKSNMARVIVAGCFDLAEVPAPDDHRVVRLATAGTVKSLRPQYEMVIDSVLEKNFIWRA